MAEGFTCDVEEEYRSVCADLPQYQDTGYCVLHYPGEEKDKEEFLSVKKSKLDRKDYYFSGTVFPEGTADFEGREFDANTDFSGAIPWPTTLQHGLFAISLSGALRARSRPGKRS